MPTPTQYQDNIIRSVSGTVNVEPKDFVLNVNTSSEAATINLLEIGSPFSAMYKLVVIDASGNAGNNNITIVAPAGFKINGQQQIVLQNNNESCAISISNDTNYLGISSSASNGALTGITVYNTVYVMKNGNDSTGLVQRFDKPFLTIAAARTAALAAFTSRTANNRVLIEVEKGYWEEDIILDEYIDYNLNSSVINGCITDDEVLFSASGDNVWTNIVYGNFRVYNQRSTGNVAAVVVWRSNTKLLMYADSLVSKNDDSVAILNGTVRIFANKIYTESTAAAYQIALELGQGYQYPDYTASRVEIFNCDIFNTSSSSASVIAFTSGSTNKNQTLSLINCRVKAANNASSEADKSCIACGIQIASDGKLNLYNTVLYSANGNSIYVASGQTLTVYYYHSNMSNAATGGTGTLTVALGALTVNAAVEAGF